jgi:hypothetical protein
MSLYWRRFNDSDLYQKFEVDGPLFVDGDLHIVGANVKFNSTIYVTGKTRSVFQGG